MMRALVMTMVVLGAADLAAQDRRTVVEPRVPPVCRSLSAAVADPSTSSGQAPSTSSGRGDEPAADTARIQNAIDACAPGTAVELRPSGGHGLFVSGPLELRRGITLLVAEGATLIASRNPRDYDVHPGSCGTVDAHGGGCRPLIHVGDAPDAAIMGAGAIDGRGGATLDGQHESWWDLAQDAKVRKLTQNVPRLVAADHADNFVLYGITLRNSPNFHVVVSRTRGFTAWGVRIDAPRTARNTDGIDPSSSTDVTIVHSFIRCGDDNVAIKAGGNGPAAHMTIAHNHFYSGHGMSIGSETNGGVSDIEVDDLTIDGADNGLRIKSNRSRGGLVRRVRYRDVCLRNVRNPLVLDREYDGVKTGPLEPRYEDIRYEDVRIGDAPACIGRFVPFPSRPGSVDPAPR
jgi:polygalacturonase